MEKYCQAKVTSSVRPSAFLNRSAYPSHLVTFPISDPHIPVFQEVYGQFNESTKKEMAALRQSILTHHTQYQHWIWIYPLSGLSFYIWYPLWSTVEGGLLAEATKGMQSYSDPDDILPHVNRLRKYLGNHKKRPLVSLYSYYWVFECINLINAMMHPLLYDWLLDYEFIPYGRRYYDFLVEQYHGREHPNPMEYTFPKTVLCERWTKGAGNKDIYESAMCVHMYNDIYDKVVYFLFLIQ